MRERAQALFLRVQAEICNALEHADGVERFATENWTRSDDGGGHGGGGVTRVLKRGAIFEQAGVNFSAVEGTLPESMVKKLLGRDGTAPFFATGVSLVLHPYSPHIPTTHANFRFLEVSDQQWFGGGADLTPFVLYDEDAAHFHGTLKSACDRMDSEFYPCFKQWCDEYFLIPHRGETRGIGGVFFDYLGRTVTPPADRESSSPRVTLGRKYPLSEFFPFLETVSRSFLPAYLPIIERRRAAASNEDEKEFQLLRRGRYAEFNLVYDRGTQFGLATGGRTESILMSLPPLVRWEYEAPVPTAPQMVALLEAVRRPRDWVSLT